VSLARWYDARQAALSLRFDDSHPTHLTKAIPILREYGFRGTFMINPGADEPGSRRRSSFQIHRAAWEAAAKSGDSEFANHSAHHRGATGDDDMDAEIGAAARAIWKLTPGQSRLTALNLGGGTQWTTSRTLRYYLDKYHHLDVWQVPQ
jgi:peptidoglycan/xylan/chitin deacetylase (PgdA/CDA1 family)